MKIDMPAPSAPNAPRPQLALVTSDAFPHLYEDDLLLVDALAELGIDGRPTVWSDASVDWLAYDAIVIRTPGTTSCASPSSARGSTRASRAAC